MHAMYTRTFPIGFEWYNFLCLSEFRFDLDHDLLADLILVNDLCNVNIRIPSLLGSFGIPLLPSIMVRVEVCFHLLVLCGFALGHEANEKTLDYTMFPINESKSAFLVTIKAGDKYRYNVIVGKRETHIDHSPSANEGGSKEKPQYRTQFYQDALGTSLFLIDENLRTIHYGVIRNHNQTISTLKCNSDTSTCIEIILSESFDELSRLLRARASSALESKDEGRRRGKRAYSFHALRENQKYIYRVAVQIVADLDFVRYGVKRQKVGANCLNLTSNEGGYYPRNEQACDELYQYFRICIGFVSMIFDNINHPEFKIEIYLSDVLIGYGRLPGGVNRSMAGSTTNSNGHIDLTNLVAQVQGFRAEQAVRTTVGLHEFLRNAAATIMVTNYSDPSHLGWANKASACQEWTAAGIFTDKFAYSPMSIKVFAHILGLMFGAEPHPGDGLMAESPEEMTEQVQCISLKQMHAFLGFGYQALSNGSVITRQKVADVHCVHRKEQPTYERSVTDTRKTVLETIKNLKSFSDMIYPDEIDMCKTYLNMTKPHVCNPSNGQDFCKYLYCRERKPGGFCLRIFDIHEETIGPAPDGMGCCDRFAKGYCKAGQCVVTDLSSMDGESEPCDVTLDIIAEPTEPPRILPKTRYPMMPNFLREALDKLEGRGGN